MKKLQVFIEDFENNYARLKKEWDGSDNIYVAINNINNSQLKNTVCFLIKKIPDDFALCLLAELSEHKNLSINLLKQIYTHGDTGCKVAICLRDDLDNELNLMCMQSDEEIVREHFSKKNNEQ